MAWSDAYQPRLIRLEVGVCGDVETSSCRSFQSKLVDFLDVWGKSCKIKGRLIGKSPLSWTFKDHLATLPPYMLVSSNGNLQVQILPDLIQVWTVFYSTISANRNAENFNDG
jgi:hypothetical protein